MDFALGVRQSNEGLKANGARPRRAIERQPWRIALLDLDWPAPDQWTARQCLQFAERLRALSVQHGLVGAILTGPELFCSSGKAGPTKTGAKFDDILEQIANSRVPVVAALPGGANGAGLELAVACAARVGGRSAVLALPGIRSASLPSVATLRKLPRLIGIEKACTLVAVGSAIDGVTAKELGLFDALEDENPVAAAGCLIDAWHGPPSGTEATPDPLEVQARFFIARRVLRKEAPNQTAALSAVTAMEVAMQGRMRVAESEVGRIAHELAQSDQGKALRYAARALEDAACGIDSLADRETVLAQQLWWPMAREAIHLLDEGAWPSQIDKCFTDFGFPTGPFAKADTWGFEAVFTPVFGALPTGADWLTYSPTLDLMVDSGRVGGDKPGWYQHGAAGTRNRADPIVDRLTQSSAISQRLRRMAISGETIMNRCLNAAINRSFEALGECEGMTTTDIDALWLRCLGFPRWRGGIMYHARARGLNLVRAELVWAARQRNTAGDPSETLIAHTNAGDLQLVASADSNGQSCGARRSS